MKKFISFCFCAVLLCACSGAKYYVRGDKAAPAFDSSHTVVIVKNAAVKEGFLSEMVRWFSEHAYKTVVAEPGAQDVSRPYLTYTARWSFDLGIFLSASSVQLFVDGQPTAASQLKVPNNFNLNKYGGTEERIENLLSLLFFHQPANGQKPNVIFEVE